jgi:hypothetical protein
MHNIYIKGMYFIYCYSFHADSSSSESTTDRLECDSSMILSSPLSISQEGFGAMSIVTADISSSEMRSMWLRATGGV